MFFGLTPKPWSRVLFPERQVLTNIWVQADNQVFCLIYLIYDNSPFLYFSCEKCKKHILQLLGIHSVLKIPKK